ncbi:MAG: PEGA domain-containing protein [Myxococcota bacterium]
MITDPPAAGIAVDGQSQGRTPTKLELEPGTYRIDLTSGKASGSFTIDAGTGEDRFCYTVQGKKIYPTACN